MCDSATRPLFIPVPNTARVRMVYDLFGQKVMNVFYWEQATPFTTSDLAVLNNAIKTAWEDNVQAVQSNDLTLSFLEATALDSAAGFQETLLVDEVGGAAVAAMPGNVTWAIKFASGLTGRSQRGRMYFLGLHETDVTGNAVVSSAAALILAAYEGFFGDVATATGATHVVVSYCALGVWRSTGQTTPITAYINVDDLVDSQRRRLTGRGQ
jgi:hypothetical protein